MSSIIDNQILTELICAKDEEMFTLIKKYVKDITEEKYEVTEKENYLLFTLRGQNKKNIMLSAHIDTVHQQKPTLICHKCTLEGWKMSSENGIGGDDRSGVYAILSILSLLKKFSVRMPKYLLFTDMEEIDCIGAKDFVNENKRKINVDLIMEFDCERDYAVFPMKKENASLESLFGKYFIIKKLPYTCDIDVLIEGFDACGVNIGVGYEKWHRLDETINVNMLENQIIKSATVIEKILSNGY